MCLPKRRKVEKACCESGRHTEGLDKDPHSETATHITLRRHVISRKRLKHSKIWGEKFPGPFYPRKLGKKDLKNAK